MKRMLIFPLLLGLLALTGCSSDRIHASEESFFAMDTVMQFQLYGGNDEVEEKVREKRIR